MLSEKTSSYKNKKDGLLYHIHFGDFVNIEDKVNILSFRLEEFDGHLSNVKSNYRNDFLNYITAQLIRHYSRKLVTFALQFLIY